MHVSSTAKVGQLRDGVEPFCVGKERVQLPDRVEDQADLSEIKTFGNVSEFEGVGNEGKNILSRPSPGTDPSGSKTVS